MDAIHVVAPRHYMSLQSAGGRAITVKCKSTMNLPSSGKYIVH
jgi:hypothetical protein